MNLWLLVLTAGLLIMNGVFVGAEFALTGARRTRIEALREQGDRRAGIALKSMRELPMMLAGAQLGITMASLGLGHVAEPAFAHLFERLFGPVGAPSGLSHTLSYVVALIVVVYLHMVIGEMAPKNLTIAEPERSALWLALPTRAFVTVFRPFVHLLNGLARLGLRALRVEPAEELLTAHSADEIARLIEEAAGEGMLGIEKHRLLSGALELSERDAAAAMVPRTEMVAASVTATPADLERLVLETGHSRIPIYGKDIDHVFGFFHAKDLLGISPSQRDKPLTGDLIRQMLVVPESRRLRPVLFDMRRQRKHFALVIDEHGGTAGILTLENVVEELVGEIRDEYDAGELGVEELGAGRYLVPGTLRIDEARSLIGIDLPEGEYETVAGFLMDRLGRIPRRRDAVEVDGWILRVRTMYRRRVVQVLVERTQKVGAAS